MYASTHATASCPNHSGMTTELPNNIRAMDRLFLCARGTRNRNGDRYVLLRRDTGFFG
jgi:hypothetical protein